MADEDLTAIHDGPWSDPADPRRRVADALRRLTLRSVVRHPGRDQREWAALAEQLEALLTGPDPAASATRYDPDDLALADFARVRPNSRGTHPLMGYANAVAPPLQISFDGTTVIADVVYDARHEGLGGFVQGGFIAAAFDLLLAQAVSRGGGRGVTASLTVNYKALTAIGQPFQYRAAMDRADGRKAYSEGSLVRLSDGVVTATATGLFISPRRPIADTQES
jgi:acyl-coenzyme A thioesterase PaaI-like protein